MSNIYFVRHGQAGTREAYDTLSPLGRRQARRLGEYFVAEGVEFAAAYAGNLRRQRETAEEVGAAYAAAGLRFPEVTRDAGWDEFDFHRIYEEIAPLMCADDAEFRREYEAVRAEALASAGAHGAEVHRRWRPSDTKVVEAWVGGRYPHAGETWAGFVERVTACRLATSDERPRPNVAVFTSATPTAVWTGRALGVNDTHVRRLASVLLNTSYTLLKSRGEELLLVAFNSVPHLDAPSLRTLR